MAEVIGEMCQEVLYSCPCESRGALIVFFVLMWVLTLILLWRKQEECKTLQELL